MAMTATDRWKILSNIVAQQGTDKIDLHAELAKAESMVNVWDTQKSMQVSQPVTPSLRSQNMTSSVQPAQEPLPPENTPIQNG